MDKTLRLIRISATQRVLSFFSGTLCYKSNRKLFSCVCIAWYKHSRRWENSRQLSKHSNLSRVCITVSNSPNPPRVYIRLCKHGKRFLLLKCSSLMGHFWVASSLCFKARLSVKPLMYVNIFMQLILMRIKLIFTRKVLHLASFWKSECSRNSEMAECFSMVLQFFSEKKERNANRHSSINIHNRLLSLLTHFPYLNGCLPGTLSSYEQRKEN